MGYMKNTDNPLISLARPTRFERVTYGLEGLRFAFSQILATSTNLYFSTASGYYSSLKLPPTTGFSRFSVTLA